MMNFDTIQTTDVNGNTVFCANIQSAIAYRTGRLPCKVEAETSFTYKAEAFVSPTGQYYVEILAGSERLRMDVANAQTALHYVRNGVPTSIASDYLLNQ